MSDKQRPQLLSVFRSAVPISVEAHATTERKVAPNGEEYDVKIVASTERVARDGGIVPMSAWAGGGTKQFLRNPVILFAHNGNQPPVAQAVDMQLDTAKGRMVQWWRFHAGLTDDAFDQLASRLKALYAVGGMRAASVGFRVEKMRDPNDDEIAAAKKAKDRIPWWVAEKAELVETSAVPVPADPHALAIDRGLDDAERKGMDVACIRDAWKQCRITLDEAPPEEPNPVEVPEAEPVPVTAAMGGVMGPGDAIEQLETTTGTGRGDGPCIDDLTDVVELPEEGITYEDNTTTLTGRSASGYTLVISAGENGTTVRVLDSEGNEVPQDEWPEETTLPVRDERDEPDMLDELYDTHLAIFGEQRTPQPQTDDDMYDGLDADTVRRIVREEVEQSLQRRRGVLPRHLR
jgi:hypothetical protein